MERIPLFIDLDDTLISNEHTKNVLLTCLEEVGFSREQILEAYPQARGEDGFFAPHAYLSALNASSEQEARWDLLWKSHRQALLNGLFPGAIAFLQGINREKYIPKLLTLGNPTYQEEKVNILDIRQYFEELHFCTEEKADFLLKLIPRETQCILVDDRVDCCEAVRKAFPNSQTYATFSDFSAVGG